MKVTNNNTVTYNIGCTWFTYALTILFVALKLLNVIDWSWWLVFAPPFVPYIIILFASAIAFVLVLLMELWERVSKQGKKK